MSSLSTVIFRKSRTIHDNKALYQKTHYHMGFISWCLWTFAAVIAAATAETSGNATGQMISEPRKEMKTILIMLRASLQIVGSYRCSCFLKFLWKPHLIDIKLNTCLWCKTPVVDNWTVDIAGTYVIGVSVTFKVQDVLIMLLTTCMLVRGLSGGNPYLVYPWIVISSWNIYYNQYPCLIRMLTKLKQTKRLSLLAIAALGIDMIGMVTKALLIFRVVQLSINLWYQRKLQCETLGKL